ncbi:non-ribosomal peptide synthetase [Saccharomonospora glauca]|uniref:Amino acid adenylation enzyme/thioester reductase family protein n=1 Tax=Saccharomonospora glauca K62 TaxID=928724 RepID=I1D2H1_9PSEU|nr:non-ribosomal peptide synthetase [Saccharomonospora glauca]EIE99145.1 amino acid adenylation enzyme/thioester reductase family protein [Saccharomonospora glauca K62]
MTPITVPTLVDRHAEITPDAVALWHPDGTRLTYARLRDRTDDLARVLAARGVRRETPVGIVVPRGVDAVVLMLAVLKCGGYCVPLDPEHPESHRRRAIADSGASLVLTGIPDRSVVEERDTLPEPPLPGNAAYLVYTSGSTGVPKGVVATHDSVANLVTAPDLGIEPGDRVLHYAPLAFDASVFELWGALARGATVAVAPPGTLGTRDLLDFMESASVTVAWLTAGLFHELVTVEKRLPTSLRMLFAGGDTVRADVVRRAVALSPGLRLVNGYGPTECTTFTTLQHGLEELVTEDEHTVPIGRPLPRVATHVLDERLDPVPDGVIGQLYVSGANLARGYHGRPGVTAERFVPLPGGARMYRTGDLVRRRPDGVLEFHGRVDRQVKIRGFRVEPGELEARLGEHPEIRAAAAVGAPDGDGGTRLVAYLVAENAEAGLDLDGVRSWLAERVPPYLVPSAFLQLPELPLTANGKVDTAALPAPDSAGVSRGQRAPRTPAEKLVAEIWCEVLGVEEVGMDDNFFELGGDSLRMNRVAAALRKATGRPVALADLLLAETAGELARSLGDD